MRAVDTGRADGEAGPLSPGRQDDKLLAFLEKL
jgi:hypothetical protein